MWDWAFPVTRDRHSRTFYDLWLEVEVETGLMMPEELIGIFFMLGIGKRKSKSGLRRKGK